MIHRGVGVLGAVLLALAGCTTGGTANPAPTTTAPSTTGAPATATPTPATTPPPATTAAPVPDPLAFFRGQEGPCGQHAKEVGNSPVEPDRFSGAKVVRDLGNGATQIEDGRGTKLVVVPLRGTVLPASGNPSDVMPPPYEFACSEKIFVGAAHD
jgi:hypothetical protein